MRAVIRMLPLICTCAFANAFAAGYDSNSVEPDQTVTQSSAPAAPADATQSSVAAPADERATTPVPSASAESETGAQQSKSGTTPAAANAAATATAAANKPAKVVLVDDTLTTEQLKSILAKGYKAEGQASGNEALFCRRERQLGTRFETKVCKTSSRILQDEVQGKDMTTRAQRTGPSMGR